MAPLAVELFAGAGTFTTALLDAGWRVEAYDAAQVGEAFAETTAGQGDAVFHRADLLADGVPLPQPTGTVGLVLLDPPRAGASGVMDWLVGSAAHTVLYVSCDLATALRDARRLIARGFELQQARSYDMLPHSGHQEVALVLTRIPRAGD